MILNDKDIVGFMQSQIKRANEFTFSDKQQKIIEDRILNDFEKYMKSKSFEARFLDYLREGED